jgi:hypothetical protein
MSRAVAPTLGVPALKAGLRGIGCYAGITAGRCY